MRAIITARNEGRSQGMGTVTPIALSVQQVVDLVRALDGEVIPKRTLAHWVTTGVTPASVRHGSLGHGHHRLFSLADVARVRLVARLRPKVSLHRLRVMLAYLDRDEQLRDELLRPRTRAALVVDPHGFTATVVRPGGRDVDIPSGQLRLELRDVVEGNAEEAKRLTA